MPVITSSGNVTYSSGTSFSAPQVSSLVAGLIQAFPDANPSGVIEAVRYSASKSLTPDDQTGYGKPSFVAAFNYLTARGQEADYLVYPNPFLSSLFIRMASPGGTRTVEIFSSEGRLLLSTSFESSWEANEVALELESLASGLYLLRITSNGVTETLRVVRQ
jgi:subtilisin family serine protease